MFLCFSDFCESNKETETPQRGRVGLLALALARLSFLIKNLLSQLSCSTLHPQRAGAQAGLANDLANTFCDHPKTERWRAATGKVIWLRLWIFQEREEKFLKQRGGGLYM